MNGAQSERLAALSEIAWYKLYARHRPSWDAWYEYHAPDHDVYFWR